MRRLLLLLLILPAWPLQAEPAAELTPAALRPVVGLIIDDLGDRLADGERALALPGAVTYSILPQTTFSRRFAEMAHRRGSEVMLHQPMQAVSNKPMGPGGFSLHMTRQALVRTLERNLLSVPHAAGVNNHMGSLLTRHPGHMAWLMSELQKRGLYFIDSKTTHHSVARKVALEQQLPSLNRNIFLDHDRSDEAIRRQFARFIAQAKSVGSSLAIGHPYPETLTVLEQLLPTLQAEGVVLLPVSALINERNKRRERLWQASLSPSPMAVKSSKQ